MRRPLITAPRRRGALLAACMIGFGGLAAPTLRAETEAPSPPPSVVVSIAPVHSLVAGVMAGVGEPTLLVKGGASPHTYTMKPSDAAALSGAQIVFRVGPGLEAFLDDPLATLASQADVVDLSEAPGLRLLPLREGGIWEAHDHGHEHGSTAAKADAADATDHDHDHASATAEPDADHDHDHGATADGSKQAAAGHQDHEHETPAPAAHGAAEAHDHGGDHDHAAAPAAAHANADAHDHGAAGDGHDHAHDAHAHDAHAEAKAHAHADEHDMHLWLDPRNAAAMTRAIVATLSDADPANADRYAENGKALEARLADLDAQLEKQLAPVRGKPFIVFHDAYQYLDARYGLTAVGTITVSPDRAPGAARIREIRTTLAERGAVCVFTEPQFEPRAVSRLVEDTGVRTGVLDPDAAAAHTPGAELYFALMGDLATNLVACLGGSS
jgi:zinc transport system substrate-binding protein